jgi:tripartite-type tricarboxylate transporter receptor subunit TctC
MEFCIDSWWFAPKDSPAEAVEGMATALEQGSATDRIQEFYDALAFAPVFLKGEALQQSLDETWARIEPVAKQAAQK